MGRAGFISWKMIIGILSQTLRSNAISRMPRPDDVTELENAFNARCSLS
jgi:hypothetical protein